MSLDRADSIAIGAERRASEVKIALAFRGGARHRPSFQRASSFSCRTSFALGNTALPDESVSPAS